MAKKNRVRKLTEEEYANYLAALEGENEAKTR